MSVISRSADKPYALLDIGSAKIACAMLLPGEPGDVLSVISVPSAGMQAGVVRDPKAAHGALVKAIFEAERQAGCHAVTARIAMNGGVPRLDRVTADLVLDPPIVTTERIRTLHSSLFSHVERGGRVAIHNEEGPWQLDGRSSVLPPLDRFGRALELRLATVTMDGAPLRRLLELVEATDLPVRSIMPAGLAAGLAVTTAQDRANGIAVLDIGAEHATVTAFAQGQLTAIATIALGTRVMVQDWVEAHGVAEKNAARIIWSCGISRSAHAIAPAVTTQPADSGSTADPTANHAEAGRACFDARVPSNTALVPRLEAMLRLAADRFDARDAGLSPLAPVVLTGGGSRIPDLAQLASSMWARPVRVGGAAWSTGELGRPEMAVLAGLALTVNAATCGVALDRMMPVRRVA